MNALHLSDQELSSVHNLNDWEKLFLAGLMEVFTQRVESHLLRLLVSLNQARPTNSMILTWQANTTDLSVVLEEYLLIEECKEVSHYNQSGFRQSQKDFPDV